MKFIPFLFIFLSTLVSAQDVIEEIIVTGVRQSLDLEPGIVLQKPADFVLVELKLINDSRDETTRKNEIYKTIQNAMDLSKKSKLIQLSYVESGIVIPLTKDNYQIDLSKGGRPDTSVTYIRVKSNLKGTNTNPVDLISKIKSFSNSISLEGRTEVVVSGDVDISVINVGQYRNELVALIAKDIQFVTKSLGNEYKVVVQGLDKPVKTFKSGSSSLSLYIPYTYQIIPDNVSSILMSPDY